MKERTAQAKSGGAQVKFHQEDENHASNRGTDMQILLKAIITV
jgi:hypothetical protein